MKNPNGLEFMAFTSDPIEILKDIKAMLRAPSRR